MSSIDKVTGQSVNYKEHNDNAPPSHSAPSNSFKSTLRFHANPECSRCRGTGYIGNFKHISGGRCFECLPDEYWNDLLGVLKATGTDDTTGEPVCEIRFVSSKAYVSAGYVVTRIGLPSGEDASIFSTIEEAFRHASAVYGV